MSRGLIMKTVITYFRPPTKIALQQIGDFIPLHCTPLQLQPTQYTAKQYSAAQQLTTAADLNQDMDTEALLAVLVESLNPRRDISLRGMEATATIQIIGSCCFHSFPFNHADRGGESHRVWCISYRGCDP
jgi:hypothetical protein